MHADSQGLPRHGGEDTRDHGRKAVLLGRRCENQEEEIRILVSVVHTEL